MCTRTRDISELNLRIEQGGRPGQVVAFGAVCGRGFDNDVVHSELGSVLREYVQMTLSGKARRLPRLRGEIQDQRLARRCLLQSRKELGHQDMRDHAREPGSWA
ncbi:Uncharacterised protein [Mycobacteroides abscessus subsp. abscessus]|nr:Uncharacterised protein [Mycobacteroides abscessus subsp. abscessus]